MHDVHDIVTAICTVLLTWYVLHCLVTLQLTDSGSELLYALYIAEHLLLCFECEILMYVVGETASCLKIQFSVHWRAEEFVCYF